MIRLISGVTRVGSRVLRPSDGVFTAPSDVEKRLVDRGVAVYADHSDPKKVVEKNTQQTEGKSSTFVEDTPDLTVETPEKKPVKKK